MASSDPPSFDSSPPVSERLPSLVHASAVMQDLLERAARAGASQAKVVITGESGVGKELVARLIHLCSARARGPYVAVNCAGLTETLLESELFGHVRGSFTDAWRDHAGHLRLAHGGTLFLDEVGEMSLRMQALLLRFLDTGEIQPVGADRPNARADVRVIAATNRNLDERVAAGLFRADLLFRLRVIHLHVPPLRERPDDVPALVDHFAQAGGCMVHFSDAALAALKAYHWPGNVRELHNVVEHVSALATGELVDVEHLPREVLRRDHVFRPRRERRHALADDLFKGLTEGSCGFWQDVHRLFLQRDLTRQDLRGIVERGLAATHGNYHALLKLFRLPPDDYKRLLNFLAAHDCSVDVRPFRDLADRNGP